MALILNVGFRSAVGFVVWCGYLLHVRPGLFSAEWGVALLLFAPLVLMPSAFDLAATLTGSRNSPTFRIVTWLQAPASWMLVVAYLLPVGTTATLLALPWSAVIGLTTLTGLRRFVGRRPSSLPQLTVDAGCVFLAVGALGILWDRAGIQPFGFDPVIILLTGVHFHYAGFILPLAAALAVRAMPTSVVAGLGAIGVVLGVPLTGIGITTTQVLWFPFVEFVGVWFLVPATMLVACGYYQLAFTVDAPPPARRMWSMAATSIVAAMAMALLYGSRSLMPEVFGIPTMRAVHGTINAFGFSACALAGWQLAERATTALRSRTEGAIIPSASNRSRSHSLPT